LAKFITLGKYSLNLDHIIYIAWHDDGDGVTVWFWPMVPHSGNVNVMAFYDEDVRRLREAIKEVAI